MTKGEEYSRLYNQGYEQGKADAFREIAYSDSVIKEPFETLAYKKGRADALEEVKNILSKYDVSIDAIFALYEFIETVKGAENEKGNT